VEEVVALQPFEVLDNVDDDLDRIELWTAALTCFQHPAPEYEPGRKETVGNILSGVRDLTADVADPDSKPIEMFDNLNDDLNRIELWTAALNCFQHPTRRYQSEDVRSDELEPSELNEARDRTADVANTLKSAAEHFYGQVREGASGQAREGASQVVDAAGKSIKVERAGDVVRHTIEDQPYTTIAIALGLGLLLGRMHRPL
jgi:ElaB/YqjD/DUF883 family membrane-anchored ribosome-binding protein